MNGIVAREILVRIGLLGPLLVPPGPLVNGIIARKDPEKGRRQQPHQTLKKSKKYKGGKKHHTMVAQSAPKMPKWHHSALKA